MCKKLVYLSLISSVLFLAQNTTAEIVAYYPMDEGSGTIVMDASGKGHDATIVGTVNWVQSKPDFGTALDFPGDAASANCVRAGTWDPSESTGQVSVAAWIKWAGANSTSTFQGIVTKCDGVFVAIRWQLTMSNSTNEIGFGFGGGAPVYPAPAPPVGEWQHVAFTHDGTTATMYINGANVGTSAIALGTGTGAAIVIGALNFQSADADAPFNGTVDEVKIFNHALSEAEVQQAMLATSKVRAFSPKPKDKVEDVIRDVILSWKPGEFADKHNVYLGTVLDDVNNADAGSSLLVGPAQDANSYNPGRLEFSQIYYWRIDEINAPPDLSVHRGKIWCFTVEPYAIALDGENITATASSHAENQGPEKTIDGSGLDENGLHSINTGEMWLSSAGDPGPAWIQYEFDKPYKLHEMLVWNYNGDSVLCGLGLKDVTIEYSTDGTNWTQLDGAFEFAQAPGMNRYASDITVNFDGIVVELVKINAISNRFPGFSMYGLSEVRFMAIPVYARKPSPESETTDAAVTSSLTWRAGREAAEHNVYISTDRQAVIDGTATMITLNQTSYSPALDLSSTYYWRVDEVNNTNTIPVWEGNVWSFTTQEYLVVDDFESYNDIPTGEEGSNLVYEMWTDGYDNPSVNGSTMGYASGESMETAIVHGGKRSAPLSYNNTSASLSEVTVDPGELAVGRNWVISAPDTLVLWFYGDPNNAGTEQLYVKLNNSRVVISGVDLTQAQWQNAEIPLADFGINLTNVTQLVIGLERTGSTGSAGIVLMDDIRLRCVEQ